MAVYADAAMSSCDLIDNSVGVVTLWLGHESVAGATASQFRVPTPACWNGSTFMTSIPAPGFSAVGDAPDEILISYGACYSGAFIIGTITYFSMGQAARCCPVQVVKAPSAPLDGVVVLDCGSTPQLATAPFQLILNADGTCPCFSPTHNATWGSVKALYR